MTALSIQCSLLLAPHADPDSTHSLPGVCTSTSRQAGLFSVGAHCHVTRDSGGGVPLRVIVFVCGYARGHESQGLVQGGLSGRAAGSFS